MEKIKEEVRCPETNRLLDPALWKCDCGEELTCTEFTNTCECGADYNWNGSRLANREQWGEETGEHWSECY